MNSLMMRRFAVCVGSVSIVVLLGCQGSPTSDDIQSQQQEKILAEGTSQVGMPAIKNFRERKLVKMLLELRDQNDLSTFTYIWSDFQGRWVFFCNSVGYGIPYATQFTNPQKKETGSNSGSGYYAITLPQADPNGLFSPASAEGTWVMCKDPNGPDVKPVYIEPRSIVSPFRLSNVPAEVAAATPPAPAKDEKK